MYAKFMFAALALVPSLASAAAVTFDTPVTVAGDSDVLTSGTLVQAYTIGNTGVAGTTINGVTFAPWAITHNAAGPATIANNSLDAFTNGNPLYTAADLSSANAPFANLSGNYKSLLSKAVAAYNILFVQLGGLTPGQSYTVQFWFSDSALAYGGNSFSIQDADISDEEEAYPNAALANGGVGQYAVGHFIADATTQDFRFGNLSASESLLNGFQVRAVPEPASLSMLALGAMTLLKRRKQISRKNSATNF
jgi:hypothetical protein